MIKLPNEILEEIFLHLNQYSKVECMLVCRQWRELIECCDFYRTLKLNSTNNVKKIVKKIQENPNIANRVEELAFGPIALAGEGNTLFFLLSNLKTVYCPGNLGSLPILRDGKQYPWKDHIECISEFSVRGLAYNLLSTSNCPNLKTLRASYKNGFINFIRNASALTTLVLERFDANFTTLETLHDSLPQLISLKIIQGRYSASGFNDNIQPATSVTECSFWKLFHHQMESELSLFIYITKKYPNLSTLEYIRSLKKGNTDTETLNNLGWIPFFSKVGSKLKNLSIDTSTFSNSFFGIVDKSGCQISYLDCSHIPLAVLKKNIVKSQQLCFIHSFAFTLRNGCRNFDWLKEFKVLKKLMVTTKCKNKFKLNDILKNCPPTLKILSFSFIEFEIDLDCINQYNIESLTFKYMVLPTNMDVFISQHFPKLSTLKLHYSGVPKRIFNMKNSDLHKFSFSGFFPEGNGVILVICSNGKHWYNYRDVDFDDIPDIHLDITPRSLLPVPYRLPTQTKANVEPNFTLICNSLQHVVFTE